MDNVNLNRPSRATPSQPAPPAPGSLSRPILVTAPSPARDRLSSAEVRRALVQLLPVLGVLLLFSVLLNPGGLTGDEGPMIGAAHRVLQGRYAVPGTTDSTKFLWHGPGLPALLAPLVALGVPLNGLRLTTPLLMFAAVLMFYRLLRLRLTPRGALIGAYALGLYGPAYYTFGTLAKEPLALLLSISALDGTARYLRDGRRRHAAIAGLSLGALVMTRLEYGWVITIALAVGLVWWLAGALVSRTAPKVTRVPRRWALVCVLGLLACVPWLSYTYALTGHVFYWGNSGGLSLYWMAAPGPSPLGEWHAPHTVLHEAALASYRPFFNHLATLTPVQRDLALQHVAVVDALAHPVSYALNVLANVGRMFVGLPFPFTLPVAVIAGLIIINGALLTGAVAAGRSLIRRRALVPRETVPFVLFAAVGLAVHLFPAAEPRMVVPLIPVPIWLIGVAFSRRRAAHSRAGTEPSLLSLAA